MTELKLGDVFLIEGKRFEVDQLKPSAMNPQEMIAFFAPVREKEPEWVECEVLISEVDGGWGIRDPRKGGGFVVLSAAVNIPGFGGVLYEEYGGWCDVPAYISAPTEFNGKPLNPVKVRFWREAL